MKMKKMNYWHLYQYWKESKEAIFDNNNICPIKENKFARRRKCIANKDA